MGLPFGSPTRLVLSRLTMVARSFSVRTKGTSNALTLFPLDELERAGHCDSRCSNAKTPICHCICGGKNHGTRSDVESTTAIPPFPPMMPEAMREVLAGVRRDDPTTSLEAAEAIGMSGRAKTLQKQVCLAIARLGGDATVPEIAEYLGVARDSISPRMAALVESGTIYDTGAQRTHPKGRACIVWSLKAVGTPLEMRFRKVSKGNRAIGALVQLQAAWGRGDLAATARILDGVRDLTA